MAKTGESYSSARRIILHESPTHDPTSSGLRTDPGGGAKRSRAARLDDSSAGPDRWHLPGNVPATAALRVLLTAAGVRDAAGSQPLSEAMCFGIAGGVGIGVAAFLYEKEDFASLYIAGRHSWQDHEAYVTAAAKRLGVKASVLESGGAKAADKHLRDALAGGKPCIAFCDMAGLPHRAMPQQFAGMGYHIITVYSASETNARIGDLTDDPIDIPLDALAASRARIKQFKNRIIAFEDAPAGAADLAAAVRAGLEACHAGLSGKPMKGYPQMFNLDSLKQLAERMHGSNAKQRWEVVFARGHRLWAGLSGLHDFIENYGTGGGLCRPIFAAFLSEAADLLSSKSLRALAEHYAALGVEWTALADAALPRGVKLFDEARELYARRTELVSAGTDAARDELRDVWQQIVAIGPRARAEFPLSERECDQLRVELQRRVRALHAGEVEGQRAIGAFLSDAPA